MRFNHVLVQSTFIARTLSTSTHFNFNNRQIWLSMREFVCCRDGCACVGINGWTIVSAFYANINSKNTKCLKGGDVQIES